jgi:hypothetical protein
VKDPPVDLPSATVVISGGGKGDQPAGSPEVTSLGRLGESLVGSAEGGKQLDRL